MNLEVFVENCSSLKECLLCRLACFLDEHLCPLIFTQLGVVEKQISQTIQRRYIACNHAWRFSTIAHYINES